MKTKFFVAKIYAMYDGKEFKNFALIAAPDESIARGEIDFRLSIGDFSFSEIEEQDASGYWSEFGAHVTRLQSLTEISETTYNEMKNIL